MSRILTVKEFEEQITNMAKECECPEWIARAYVGIPERNEMTDLQKAAEMALEALNEVTGWQLPVPMRVMDEVEDAIEALRQALAHTEQEPDRKSDRQLLKEALRSLNHLSQNAIKSKTDLILSLDYAKQSINEINKRIREPEEISDYHEGWEEGFKAGLAKTQPEQEHFCDTHCVHTDHYPDCELAQPEQEPVACECHRCIKEYDLEEDGLPLNVRKMILCPECGNKRCPKASDHRLACTGSNEVGQKGSVYAAPISEPVKNLEPVLWIKDGVIGRSNVPEGYTGVLYTAPLKRVWQGLTDEDWHNLPSSDKKGCERDAEIFNWIEDKLKEKNT